MKVAIVALGPSSLTYPRVIEAIGDWREAYDEVWTINGNVNVFWPWNGKGRGFVMDDVRIQYMRAKAGNAKIGRLLKSYKKHPGPLYTSVPLPETPSPLLPDLRKAWEHAENAPDMPEEDRLKLKAKLDLLEAEADMIEGGGFDNMVAYPLEEVVNCVGRDYFNNSVAYAIAFGIYQRVEVMNIFGADFTFPDRHLAEMGRANCEYLLGIADERGIKIGIAAGSSLLDTDQPTHLYGYDSVDVHREVAPEDGHVSLSYTLKEDVPSAIDIERRYYKGTGKKK